MTSVVQICNLALQKLGASHIVSLTEDSKGARECNLAYEPVRDAELRAHTWNFAKARVVLAPDSTAPPFGFDYQFTLPSDFLRLHPVDEETDWTIEGNKLLTNDGDTLNLGYIKRVTDPNIFDSTFVEVLAARLAMELAEPITQSNTKKDFAVKEYKRALLEARRVNAIENVSVEPPTDRWISVRA